MAELKPCPFCGGNNIYIDGYEHGAGLRWRVMCLDCMGMVDPGTFQQKYRAIELWNLRAEPVVQGKWVAEQKDAEYCEFTCSECDYSTGQTDQFNETEVKDFCEWYRFCPSCGAKMEQEVQNG